MSDNQISQKEVQSYSGLSAASLRAYVTLGIIPRPLVERKGHGTKVWYPQEVSGLLTDINRLQLQGMTVLA